MGRRTDQGDELLALQQRLASLEAQVGLAQLMTRSFAGEIRFWSRGMERLYGFTSTEAVGHVSHALLRTEFPLSRQDVDRELLERSEWTGELLHRRRDGSAVMVASHQSLHRAPDGEPLLVTEVNNDITAGQRERQVQQHLASIVESSDDAIVSKTLDGTIIAWNSAAETMFGYRAGEIIGRPIDLLCPPDRVHEMAMIIERLKRGERVRHYETIRLRKDGSEVHVSLSVSPLRDASGRVIGASKTARDITQERRSQARIQELQTELVHAARLSTMGQMASAIAHELNQPLTAVGSYAGALDRLLATTEPNMLAARDVVERIRRQTNRAGEVIRRLRNYAANRSTTRLQEDINVVVAEAVELAMVGARHLGVRTVLELDPSDGVLLMDRIQIGQVIINLVRNATEAMAATERKELTILTRREGNVVAIDVADSGSGIAPEIRDRLFQPFVTSKADGLGLGLSICREIAEAHGGELTASPRAGGGTVFTLRLPLGEDGCQA